MPSCTIDELGELSTGFQVRSAITNFPEAPHRIITLGDVTEEGILYERLAHMNLGARIQKYILREGDVLFRSRGANYKAAVVSELSAPTVAIAPLYILRVQPNKILPEYLAWWINREDVQGKLSLGARGSYIPTVSKEAFANLEIPLPPLPTQQQIAEVQRMRLQEREITNRLNFLRKQQIEATLLAATLNEKP